MLKKPEERIDLFPIATSVPASVVDQLHDICNYYDLNRAEVLRQLVVPAIDKEWREVFDDD